MGAWDVNGPRREPAWATLFRMVWHIVSLALLVTAIAVAAHFI